MLKNPDGLSRRQIKHRSYLKNYDTIRESNKRWHDANKEKFNAACRENARVANLILKDHVVRGKIKRSTGFENPSQEFIDIWRETLLVKRAAKKVQEALDERTG